MDMQMVPASDTQGSQLTQARQVLETLTQRARAVIGEQFHQHRMRQLAIQNNHALHAALAARDAGTTTIEPRPFDPIDSCARAARRTAAAVLVGDRVPGAPDRPRGAGGAGAPSSRDPFTTAAHREPVEHGLSGLERCVGILDSAGCTRPRAVPPGPCRTLGSSPP